MILLFIIKIVILKLQKILAVAHYLLINKDAYTKRTLKGSILNIVRINIITHTYAHSCEANTHAKRSALHIVRFHCQIFIIIRVHIGLQLVA